METVSCYYIFTLGISLAISCISFLFFWRGCLLRTQEYPSWYLLLKINNRNTRTRCEVCSKLTIKIPELRQWRRSGLFVNCEHISHFLLVFLLLSLNM